MNATETITITICMGSACFARGNAENLTFIEEYVKKNNLDAKIDIVGSRCEGKCANGPNIIINGKEYNNVTTETLENLLNE